MDKIFTLPLSDFGSDPDGDLLTWSAATSDPIESFFSQGQGCLYVHSKGVWYGRGKISIRLEDNSGAFTEKEVSVVVFKEDGTLLREDGKKTEYYIPWHPELDINRIASVEQFLLDYGKEEENLDQTIHWSPWKKAEFMKDVLVINFWKNELSDPEWPIETNYKMIDVFLDEMKDLNIEWIDIGSTYYMLTLDANEMVAVYDTSKAFGPTLRVEDISYIINSAHNKGLKVRFGPYPYTLVDTPDGYLVYEIWQTYPSDLDLWFDNYWQNQVMPLAELSTRLGLDVFKVASDLVHIDESNSMELANQHLANIADKARGYYRGPLMGVDCFCETDVTYFDHVDIITNDIFPIPTNNFKNILNPTVEEVKNSLELHFDNRHHPYQTLYKKPLVLSGSICHNADGYISWIYGGDEQTENLVNDLEEQSTWFEALFQAIEDEDWILGCMPNWVYFFPFNGDKTPKSIFAGFMFKPAERVIEKYYGNGVIKPRIIRIDGDISDWSSLSPLATDLIGDNNGRGDLTALYGILDDDYLYLRAQFSDKIAVDDTFGHCVVFKLDLNNDGSPEWQLTTFYSIQRSWGDQTYPIRDVSLTKPNDWSILFGKGDGIDNNNNIELRLHRSLLAYSSSVSIQVECLSHLDGNLIDEITGFHQVYFDPNIPMLILDKQLLIFGSMANSTGSKDIKSVSSSTSNQKFRISSTAENVEWEVKTNSDWIKCNPASGNGDTVITASVDPSGLSVGSYTGTITVSSATAANSPQTVSVILNIYAAGSDAVPFGSFDTPIHGSTVMSSVPVTGWVLDDIGVESVKIYRDPVSGEGNNLIYIGDALFVEGARPDVEALYPDYPLNYQAGWGYMLLTNFLPNQGNGTFVLYAVATDTSGNQVTLGSKTITCDNANAVKPFGAIDTPSQGGTASGNAYVNFGWALTPMPNLIPTDGNTINVFVDGVNLGHPAYNNYRADIATLFPGYANSDGAVGFYTLDTTAYANGVHSIVWSVEDNVGNVDGIGSRYFSIFNGSSADAAKAQGISERVSFNTPMSFEEVISTVPSFDPIAVKKGYRKETIPVSLQPDSYGVSTIEIKEVERLEINLTSYPKPLNPEFLIINPSPCYTGFLVIGQELRPLPIGSTLNPYTGIFSWQPGPGFLGEYNFIFLKEDAAGMKRKIFARVNIKPKFSLN